MGRSAKFHKRPTRKDKMGLSSSSTSSLALQKAPLPPAPPRPAHRRPTTEASPAQQPLIEDPVDDEAMDEEGADEGQGEKRRKRAGLKAKVARQKDKAGEGTGEKADYVDLYDRPDRRKGRKKKA